MARPKEFVREDALQRAMQTFWSKGYEATSIPDLMQSMGISRSSLYDTFGDKQALFSEALSYYVQSIAQQRIDILRNARSAKQGLKDFFDHQITVAVDECFPGGCLLTNTATALKTVNDRIAALIKAGAEEAEKEFYSLLKRAQQSGEIEPKKDIVGLARMFLVLTYGINVVARVNPNRELLQDIAQTAISTLD